MSAACSDGHVPIMSTAGVQCLYCGLVFSPAQKGKSHMAVPSPSEVTVTGDQMVTGIGDYRQCAVDFCGSIIPRSRVACYEHDGYSAVESEVIPQYHLIGPQGTLYSGLRYRITAKSSLITLTFIGVFVPGNPLAWRLTFHGDKGARLNVSVDAITDIVAI